MTEQTGRDWAADDSFATHPMTSTASAVPHISWAEVAESCATEGSFPEGNRRDARMLLCPALAQATGTVMPRAGILTPGSVRSARETVNAAGGVSAAIDDFRAGRDSAAVEALFRPWSGTAMSHNERVEVTELISSRGADCADEIWASALKFANRDSAGRIAAVVNAWVAEPHKRNAA